MHRICVNWTWKIKKKNHFWIFFLRVLQTNVIHKWAETQWEISSSCQIQFITFKYNTILHCVIEYWKALYSVTNLFDRQSARNGQMRRFLSANAKQKNNAKRNRMECKATYLIHNKKKKMLRNTIRMYICGRRVSPGCHLPKPICFVYQLKYNKHNLKRPIQFIMLYYRGWMRERTKPKW